MDQYCNQTFWEKSRLGTSPFCPPAARGNGLNFRACRDKWFGMSPRHAERSWEHCFPTWRLSLQDKQCIGKRVAKQNQVCFQQAMQVRVWFVKSQLTLEYSIHCENLSCEEKHGKKEIVRHVQGMHAMTLHLSSTPPELFLQDCADVPYRYSGLESGSPGRRKWGFRTAWRR